MLGCRGVDILVNSSTRQLSTNKSGLTPNPSPRGEGSNMQCDSKANKGNSQGFNKANKATTNASTKQTKPTTPANKASHSPLPLERGWG